MAKIYNNDYFEPPSRKKEEGLPLQSLHVLPMPVLASSGSLAQ